MLYFRQVLAGEMQNFVYLIGDRDSGECVAVDPAWDVAGLIDEAGKDGMKITGALCTHYHPDHVGGDLFGFKIEGLARLLELNPCKIYVNKLEAEGVRKVTGVSESDLVRMDDLGTLEVGAHHIEFVHTPGHTPGSQCFLVDGDRLVSGDTLFIGGCGRVDLPGSNPEDMMRSLKDKLGKLADHVRLYPGHDYAAVPETTMGEEKQRNPYLRAAREDAARMFGR
jgi:hydroxyacylglutathione hydrolase